MRPEKPAKAATILIVDDEPNIRLMLRTALESEGYAVREAPDGGRAVDEVARLVPDLMLLDLNMPVLDGMAVLERLRQAPGKAPRVIVLTAYGSVAKAVRATRLGARDFLEKPVSPEELRRDVREVLAEAEPEAPRADDYAGGYAGALDRARKALRLGRFTDAESLLLKAADLSANDAAWFNLLGVLYESRRQWRLARKFYGKAIAADGRYEPAQQNMRRVYELYTFGRSTVPATLGDEAGEVWHARLPEGQESKIGGRS